jgi:uncharacterized membrane protein
MMGMFNMHRSRKLIIGLMLAMMGAHFLILGIGATGLIAGGALSSLSWIMPIGMVLVMVILMLVVGPRRMMRGHMGLHADDAGLLDILQKRFASGEITKDQYEEMKQVLQQDADASSADGAPDSRVGSQA